MMNLENDKAISPEKNEGIKDKVIAATPSRFFYPDHQVTIEAESKEEADKELEKIIRNNR